MGRTGLRSTASSTAKPSPPVPSVHLGRRHDRRTEASSWLFPAVVGASQPCGQFTEEHPPGWRPSPYSSPSLPGANSEAAEAWMHSPPMPASKPPCVATARSWPTAPAGDGRTQCDSMGAATPARSLAASWVRFASHACASPLRSRAVTGPAGPAPALWPHGRAAKAIRTVFAVRPRREFTGQRPCTYLISTTCR